MRHLAVALAPALLATVALAQPAHPPGPQGEPPAEMKAHHEAMQKQHLEDLRTVLRIRPDQEAALAAFVSAHEPKRFERRLPDPSATTTPQRLDEMARHEAEMAAQHKQTRDALAKFYAALSPDQQKVFDALHRLQGSHGGPGHGGPGRHVMMMRGGPGGPMMRHDVPH